jgi:hypothetical protein
MFQKSIPGFCHGNALSCSNKKVTAHKEIKRLLPKKWEMNGAYHRISFKILVPPRKHTQKKEALLPREIEKFGTKHPEDGDGFSLWNAGELSYLDATVCPKRFY